jgi:hypothetical protein
LQNPENDGRIAETQHGRGSVPRWSSGSPLDAAHGVAQNLLPVGRVGCLESVMDELSRWSKAVLVAAMLGGTSLTLTACDEGPLEEAGEEIDDAVDDATD